MLTLQSHYFCFFFESFKFGEMKRHELEQTGESRLLTSSPDRVQQNGSCKLSP